MHGLEKFINEKYHTDAITLRKAIQQNSQIKIFNSTYVNTNNRDDTLQYIEIPISNIQKQLIIDERKKSANPISLKNQTLKVGDVIFPMRRRLDHVLLIKERDIRSVPLVVSKWALIIRTESEKLGLFIQTFLQEPEVKSYLNGVAVTSSGIIKITRNMIYDMPFPNIFDKDLTFFFNSEKKYSDIEEKSGTMNYAIKTLKKMQLNRAYQDGINNKESYCLEEWRKLEKLYDLIDKEIDSLKEKLRTGKFGSVEL